MRRSLRSHHDDRGVVALELVLALPFLLMLIIGTVVLGNFLRLKSQAAGFARDGARAAALRLALPANTATTSYAISGAACPTPTDSTKFVTVQVTQTVSLRSIPPLLPNVLPATITETVTMRCGG
jgi:Flp pilus assembly protein TadG